MKFLLSATLTAVVCAQHMTRHDPKP